MGYKVLDDNLTLANINSDKPKVCFLHGWGRSSKDFMNIENEFESISLDIPGFGKSIPFPQSLSPKKYAEYLADIIPSTVEVLVGHSFGGRIAVHLSQIKNYKNCGNSKSDELDRRKNSLNKSPNALVTPLFLLRRVELRRPPRLPIMFSHGCPPRPLLQQGYCPTILNVN